MTEAILPLETLKRLAKAGDAQALQALRDGGLFRSRQGWPVSHAQHRLWIAEQMDPVGGAYNIPIALRLHGDLDAAALREALKALTRRHEALRTRFAMVDGELRQFVHDDIEFPWEEIDLTDSPEPDQRALELVTRQANAPFDLTAGPLFRSLLLRLGPRRHIWLLNIHHIIGDLASLDILIRESAQLYAAKGAAAALPPLPIQYKDFAIWQNQRLNKESVKPHRDYWHRQLAGTLPHLDFPADFPRPPVKSYRGSIHTTSLDADLSRRLKELGSKEGMSLFMILTALVKVLLHRHTGQAEILLGFPSLGRDHPELSGVMGCFVNMLVLRDRLDGEDTLTTVFRNVRQTLLDAYQHQAYPFDRLVEELRLPRDASRTPAFDATITLTHAGPAELRFGDVLASPCEDVYSAAKFDLAFDFTETADGLQLAITYCRDLFLPERIARLAEHFVRLAALAVGDAERPIGRLPLLSPAEWRRVTVDFNRTERDFPADLTFVDLFEEQAALRPDAPAARFQGQTLNYRELNQRANRIAHLLEGLGAGPETRVGLFLEASLDVAAAVLGILKSGAVYVPLDPANPPQRLAALLDESRLTALLTNSTLASRLPPLEGAELVCLDQAEGRLSALPPDNPPRRARPENAAYMIHTSGSTGRPKAAVLLHRGLTNNICEQRRLFAPGPGDVVLQFSSLGFDASVLEFMLAFGHGAALCLAPRERLMPAGGLAELLADERISITLLPPSTLAALPDAVLPSLRVLMAGGEACPAAVVDRWAGGRQFFNLYGPTEATIFVTQTRCEPGGGAPGIGRPIANHRVYLLDRYLQPVPFGVPGELCVAGVGLARHYFAQPQISAERFVADPFSDQPGAKLYRTGDLARYLPDGSIQFIGRIDHQVKLRGYRIELGEIETALAQHPAIALTAVLVREDSPGKPYLAAYYTTKTDEPTPGASELRQFLQAKLPLYMVPSRFVLLDEMPRTASGKIDRKALPVPDDADNESPKPFVAPGDDLERVVADIFAEVLKVARPIGASDNFFELGGDSLSAAQVIGRVRETLRVNLSLPQLFLAQDLASLAQRIRRAAPEGQADRIAALVLRLKTMSDEEKQALLRKRRS